jgi:hypothetical protein
MKKIMYLLLILLVGSNTVVNAQEFNSSVPKKIVIVLSTKDYETAKKTATEASKKLGKPLNLNGLKPNKELGLTHSKEDCESFGYPCYIPRGEGNAENSDYISVEFSNGYEGFAKGYYIVVAGIGDPKTNYLNKVLTNAKKYYKDAYAKQTKVWYGCMH